MFDRRNMEEDRNVQKAVSQSRITWRYIRDDQAISNLRMPALRIQSDTSTATTRHNGNHHVDNNRTLSIITPLNKFIQKETNKKSVLTRNENVRFDLNNCEEIPVEKHKKKKDVPQSPESQKKDELCTYLQLVKNSGNSQDQIPMKERRSVRVKNLQLLTEKKNLEKKLKSYDEYQTSTTELVNKVNEENIKRKESPTEIFHSIEKSNSNVISERISQRSLLRLNKRKEETTSLSNKIKDEVSVRVPKRMKLLDTNKLRSKKQNAVLLDDKISTNERVNIMMETETIQQKHVFTISEDEEVKRKSAKATRNEMFVKNLSTANKNNCDTTKTDLKIKTSSSTILENEEDMKEGSSKKNLVIILPSITSSLVEENHVVADSSIEDEQQPLIGKRQRSILRKLLTKNGSTKKQLHEQKTKRQRSMLLRKKFQYVNTHSNSNNFVVKRKNSNMYKTADKSSYKKGLRSRVHYNHLTMKRFMQIINMWGPMRRRYVRKNKQTKQIDDVDDDDDDTAATTSNTDYAVPLLDHNYAMCNNCSSLHKEICAGKTFTTKEIICGLNQKENEEFRNNVITEIVQNNKTDEVLHRKSILKEKLIFNTDANEFETPSSKCPIVEKDGRICNDAQTKETNNEEKDEETVSRIKSKILKINKSIDLADADKKSNFQNSFEKQLEKLKESNINNNTETNLIHKLNSVKHHISPVPVEPNVEINSLYKSLIQQKQVQNKKYDGHTWNIEEGIKSIKEKRLSHSIHILEEHGNLLDAVYVENCLVIVQELSIAFYDQSPLGNVLGAQNMWIPKGHVQRLLLDNNGCVQKETSLNIMNLDNSICYVELWTKEHKSDKRERPVCDVFAAIYFMKSKNHKPDKKLLQLENINAFSSDVRYIVRNHTRDIIVCWKEINDDKTITKIRSYNFECDYQTIAGVMEMQTVNYFIKSLHNIEDGDDLLIGFGENKTTIWNLEYGYIIATIDIEPQLETLWVKCERGFLFTLQNTLDGNLRLVAIRGMNHSWKQLTTFKTPKEYANTSLKGVCIEHGTIVAFYENGVLCWNAQTGELLMEAESSNLNYFPSFKHVIILTVGQIIIKHALAYLITV